MSDGVTIITIVDTSETSSTNNSSANYHPTCLENMRHYFSHFCKTSGIHGVQYLGERGRFLIEKLVWTIILTLVCSICLYLVTKTYYRWEASPVIVTFAKAEVPIWKIPFPAVTICPEAKSDPKIFNYTDVTVKKLNKLDVTAEEERYFEHFRVVCNNKIFHVHGEGTVIDYSDLLADLYRAFPSWDPYHMSSTYWFGKKLKWEDEFFLSLTSDGFCYSFNMLHDEEIYKYFDTNMANNSSNGYKARQWSLESGYLNDEADSYPRRSFLPGKSGGLAITGLFVNHSHLDQLCTGSLQGFKVVLHHPSELPNMDKYFRVPLDQIVLVGITPRMTTVSDELKSYTPDKRKCYFAKERSLMLFKSYTQQNCLHECFFNYTLLKCGCVPFYTPHDNGTATCGAGSNQCFIKSKLEYLSKDDGSNCNCLPFCTSLEYNIEITQSDWYWREFFYLLRPSFNKTSINTDNFHQSKLEVFYKEMQFLPSERHELYGYIEFFSNVGGLLGLFVGFSVTSFIEIIYFLSLRIICNIKKFGRNSWSGAPELINSENHAP